MVPGDARGPSGGFEHRRKALRVLVADGHGRPMSAPGVTRWLTGVAPAHARGTVSIALVGDATVRTLNRTFRGIDRATDVLSFPCDATSDRGRFFGDIIIARGLARRQARRAGHSELTELRVLALHGLLHLLGYDHEQDRGAMRRLERRLRRKGGLREGLIERTE